MASVLNDAGETAFIAGLTGSSVDPTNNSGVWSNRSGSMALVARSGDHAPGTPSGVNFFNVDDAFAFNNIALNNAGQTAFGAGLSGTGVDATNDSGIWSESSGSLTLVAREGGQALGAPSGVNYLRLGLPTLNNAGQTAFSSSLSDGRYGVWLASFNSLALVAILDSFASSVALNDAGQIAFLAGDEGTEIWATDRTGALQLIARVNDPLEIAPGDFRTIRTLKFVGGFNGAGRPRGFNNRGQLAFYAEFYRDDPRSNSGSGIFVSNRVAIPEPSTFAFITVSLICLLIAHRHSLFDWRVSSKTHWAER
jgi:hypothetical protein